MVIFSLAVFGENLRYCCSLNVVVIPPPPQRSGGGYTGIAMAVRLSVCLWTQFCPELFSYSFACTALKFIHNVCVHMKLCMCNFDDHNVIGC